ncbi:MAG: DNA mismatch repair protein MutS [Planctomycetaceae bacterium]|nr:DNA mismatch repair protein MutS [Planctomycetaceae bacterium]
MDASKPADIYREQLRKRQQRLQKLERWDQRFATFRGITFFGSLILLWQFYVGDGIPESVFLLPLAIFVMLVIGHVQLRDRIALVKRAVIHYQHALDRLKGRWQGIGYDGERYRDPDHPYANDLDLFGPGSVFELITRCQTRLGEDRLAEWFLQPADRETIGERQLAVQELTDRVMLREELEVLHPPLKQTADQNRLKTWGDQHSDQKPLWLMVLVSVLSLASISFLWGAYSGFVPISFFIASLTTQVLVLLIYRPSLHAEFMAAEHMRDGLPVAVSVLKLIESQPHESRALQVIQERLNVEQKPPSQRLNQLLKQVNLLSNCTRNQFMIPLAILFGLHFHITYRIIRWKHRFGPHIDDWLQSIGEWESLLSLAGHRFEFPNNVFPKIEAEGPIFSGEHLRHPLLEREDCVANSVSLDQQQKLLLVSGSNMSGKSTLLRTVGTNLVLAYAGSSVHAESLRLSVMQLGAAMRVSDSLREGKSLFYAVVTRLKQIVDLTSGSRELFYLIDEILPGTNSHDRRLGAEGVLRSLVSRNTLGLVTTHDLALTRIVESLDNQATNVHFEDHLEDGKMSFDYQLRPGVVKKSNALELMKMIGLDVVSEATISTDSHSAVEERGESESAAPPATD